MTKTITYKESIDGKFPLDWTTTTLEAGIPGLVDVFDYDVPLTSVFKNIGAPRFVFSKEEMNVLFSMDIDIFLEKDNGDESEEIFTIELRDILIDFDMELEDMWLNNEWKNIQLGSAKVSSRFPKAQSLIGEKTNQFIDDFFRDASDMVMAWANNARPEYFSRYRVPAEIPDIMKINKIEMGVHKNFLSFNIDPVFEIRSREYLRAEAKRKREEHQKELAAQQHKVQAVEPDDLYTILSEVAHAFYNIVPPYLQRIASMLYNMVLPYIQGTVLGVVVAVYVAIDFADNPQHYPEL